MVALHPERMPAVGYVPEHNGSATARALPALQSIQPRFGMGPRKQDMSSQPPVPGKSHSIFWPTFGSVLAVALLASGTVFGLLTQSPDVPGNLVVAKVDITTHHAPTQMVAALIPPSAMQMDDVDETGSITPRPSAAARTMPTPAAALQEPVDPPPPDGLSYKPDDEPMADIAALDEGRKSTRVQDLSSDTRTARITSSTRLRARPNAKGKVLTTLGKGTSVTLYGCKSWCEVESGRQRGYVYAKALNR